MNRNPPIPLGLSRIEDDGTRTPQTVVDATEYERLVNVEGYAKALARQLDTLTFDAMAGFPLDAKRWQLELNNLKIALGVTP